MTALLRQRRLRALFYQVVALLFLLWLGYEMVVNATTNVRDQGIATGLGFLSHTAGFGINQTLIPYKETDSFARVFVVGLLNTLLVSILGIVFATIIGFIVGIARLSSNWLLSRLAAVYVELLRDIPLLLQLLLWYVLMQGLPAARAAWKPIEGVFLSNRGLVLPSVPIAEANLWVIAAVIAGLIALYVLRRQLMARQMADGKVRHLWPYALVLLAGLPALVSFGLGASWTVTLPELRGFNFVGGLTLAPEYFALLIALVTYTSAFIAEIVRSGIQAVPRGQWDAANALGLRRSFVLQRIVLPQALRVIIPPMTSQYLNLTKNSSLAVAVGYQDVVSIANTTLNQTGQAIEAIALIMMVFLTISLGISLFMNWYNARIALVER